MYYYSEFARVYGTDLYSVITRGSQHKVEAVMIRIARPENFLLLSPSREDVRLMRAPVAQPLVMEPKSAFYTSPVIVLDFQSLYPSVMIAYNYCFSTCVGRIVSLDKPSYRFGVVPDFQVPMDVIKALEEYFIVSPNGLVFVHPSVRRGAITRMVGELLDTRVMVKDSMKRYREDKSLGKLLDARQLGLKLLANTTYGYVGSNFSGRMPCCEIGDAIVLTGRVILANVREAGVK